MTNFSGISAALLLWRVTQLPDVSVIIGERDWFVKPLRFFLSKRSPHEAQTPDQEFSKSSFVSRLQMVICVSYTTCI